MQPHVQAGAVRGGPQPVFIRNPSSAPAGATVGQTIAGRSWQPAQQPVSVQGQWPTAAPQTGAASCAAAPGRATSNPGQAVNQARVLPSGAAPGNPQASPIGGHLQRTQPSAALPQQQGQLGQALGRGLHDFLDPDQDPNLLRSPGGSLVSSVTTLACGHGAGNDSFGDGPFSARGDRRASDRASVSLSEAFDSLSARFEDSMCQLPARLNEATGPLKFELQSLSEASASCLVRTEVLEKSLHETTTSLASAQKHGEQALRTEMRDHVLTGLATERDLRQELAEEVRTLGRDLREQFQQELERLRDSVMREMRERMDGQKVLREEVQLQQGSLMRLTSRVEESLVELRTELPRMSQEQSSQHADIERIQEAMGSGGQGGGLLARLDQSERVLREQREQRLAAEADLRQELRELQLSEATRQEQQISNLQEQLDKHCATLREALDEQQIKLQTSNEAHSQALEDGRTELLEALAGKAELLRKEHSDSLSQASDNIRAAEERLKQLAEASELKQTEALAGLGKRLDAADEEQCRKELEARETLQERLTTELQEAKELLQQKLNGLERALVELDEGLRSWTGTCLRESESGMQHWVEATVSVRITSVDKALRKEMTERASTNEQVLDMITHNSERWCQLQAKFDELLLQTQKGGFSSFVAGAHLSGLSSYGSPTSLSDKGLPAPTRSLSGSPNSLSGTTQTVLEGYGGLAGKSLEDR
ncbi:unnamed protein product [Polarella glacialis]|uniref:Uncharacterized protein n=1 Tax=Polarella glacialis TaxID=89957 RepID=A0A813F721_POLGL|nr:unnamed protein product [Polarella glacialis]